MAGEEQQRIAPESSQVKRSRAKLLALWEELDEQINGKALKETKDKIKEQYHRTVSQRKSVSLDEKPLSLFADGKGVQKTASSKVITVLKRVQKEFEDQQQSLIDRSTPVIIKPLESDSENG